MSGQLHVATLLTVTTVISMVVATLFVMMWFTRRERILFLYVGIGAALVALTTELLAFRGQIPDFLSVYIANASLALAHGFFHAGINSFRHRKTSLYGIGAGMAVWCTIAAIPDVSHNAMLRSVLITTITMAYSGANTCLLMRSSGGDKLVSRKFVMALWGIHTVLSAARIPLVMLVDMSQYVTGDHQSATIGFALLGGLVLVVSQAFGLLVLEEERGFVALSRLAATDGLTGINNRRAFVTQIQNAVEIKGGEGCLLLFDIDHFKKINDTFGHIAGDFVLTSFCRLIEHHVRSPATIGRLGGEEFGCFLPDHDLCDAAIIAEAIRHDFECAEMTPFDRAIRATVSIGISATELSGHNLDRLLAEADIALYKSKTDGRNRVTRQKAPESPAYHMALAIRARPAVVMPDFPAGLALPRGSSRASLPARSRPGRSSHG